MIKLILQFNTKVGRDYLPEVEEITRSLSLQIEDLQKTGRRKVIAVTGKTENLFRLSEEMLRFPSVKMKKVD